MHFIDDAEVTRTLTFPILIAAFEDAHRLQKTEVLGGYLGSEKEQYVIRSTVDRGRYMASKMFTSFPANLAGGKMPAVQAVRVMFDGSNGKPLAVNCHRFDAKIRGRSPVAAHAGICAGGGEQSSSLPRPLDTPTLTRLFTNHVAQGTVVEKF
jgi:hypothetical protein